MLRQRSRLLAAVREFFDSRGYFEVETPQLSHEIIHDAWLEPFTTEWRSGPASASRETLYLQTSPELGMKRLLAAGARAIYQVARVFRNGEIGRLHNPEFTMVEWYRTGETHVEQMQVVEDLVAAVGRCAAGLNQDANEAGPLPIGEPEQFPFARLTYDEAFENHLGTRVLTLTPHALRRLAEDHGLVPPPGLDANDRDGWLNLLLAELIEPHLGQERPVFVYDYPASQAALARIRNGDVPVAERFELYFRGVEICNGYHELTEADEFERRTSVQAKVRSEAGLPSLPRADRLAAALRAGLPPCAGVALGFDRLVMLALGKRSIAEVLAFPFPRA